MRESSHARFRGDAGGVRRRVAGDDGARGGGAHESHDAPFGEIAIEDARAENPNLVKEVIVEADVRWARREKGVEKEDSRTCSHRKLRYRA